MTEPVSGPQESGGLGEEAELQLPLGRQITKLFEELAAGHAEEPTCFYPGSDTTLMSDLMSDCEDFDSDGEVSMSPQASKVESSQKAGGADKNWRDQRRGQLQKSLAELKERRRRLAERLKGRIERVKRRAHQADAVKLQDKLVFTCAVLNLAMTGYIAGAHPDVIYVAYSVQLVCLVALRLYSYRKEKFGYFLLDFCYFANLLLLLYLWYKRDSLSLFRVVFAFANGPLGVAVIAWRNSLVFHSVDKITSLFIHVQPAMVTYLLRHREHAQFETGGGDEPVTDVVYDMLVHGLFLYCCWQLAYYLKVQVLDREKIVRRNKSESSTKYVTSFTYLREQKSAMGNLIRRAPRRRQHFAFAALQLVYTILTLMLTPIFYFWPTCHFFWLVFILLYSTWNGSCFYFEVFAARYQEQLKQLQASAQVVDDMAAAADTQG